MSINERQLTLTIGGQEVDYTKIPFSVLAGKIGALQKGLFNIILMESSAPLAQRGNLSKPTRVSCDLFCESRKGSVTVVAEIPPPLSVQTILLDKKIDDELHALNSMKKVIESVAAGDISNLVSIMPDSGARLLA